MKTDIDTLGQYLNSEKVLEMTNNVTRTWQYVM